MGNRIRSARDRAALAGLPARFTARFVEQPEERGTRPGLIYSIDVPSGNVDDLQGVAVRPMGGSYVAVRSCTPRGSEEDVQTVRANLRFQRDAPAGSDTEAFLAGHVAITPLRFDWTDRDALAALSTWELTTD